MGSAAVRLVEVATWKLDGCVEHRISAWDRAAGLASLDEAGAAWHFPPPEGVQAGGPILAAALDAPVRRFAGAEAKRWPGPAPRPKRTAPHPRRKDASEAEL